jgi:peptidylprolyl isomerase
LDNVILGWQEGLVGMQVGGRRLLVIPAELGYGNNPPPGSGIEAGETLIFVVDLVSFE